MDPWLTRASRFLEKGLHPAIRVINAVGTMALGVMVLITVADVLLRLLLGRPIRGTFELTEFLMVIAVFFAMGYTAMLKGHIVIQILAPRLPKGPRAVLDSLADLLSIGFCCLLIWQGIVQASIVRFREDISGVTHIPIFPFYYVLVFGVAVMVLVFVANLLDGLGKWMER